MTKNYLAVGSLMVFMAGSAVAGWRPLVIPPAMTPQERLENAVRQDQGIVENAERFASKPIAVQALRAEFRKKLVADQAALDEFKTAGPTAYERARLENEIKAARFDSKLLSQRARIEAAQKKLAELDK